MKNNLHSILLKVTVILLICQCWISSNVYAQCQTITANVVSTVPATEPEDNSLIRICQGQSVTFNGQATFGTSGTGATYQWLVKDGFSTIVLDGQSVTHSFPVQGIYVIDFLVTDAEGCTNNQCDSTTRARIVVHVSTTPHFAGTDVTDTICLGQSAALSGQVTPVPAEYNCAPPVSDTTFLPDGSGVSYTTTINVSCFTPCDTISSADQIASICINMEHSYIGDVIASIQCPSGQTSELFDGNDFTPLSTYLGEPNDDFGVGCPDNMVPGVGYTYCFAPNAPLGTIASETGNVVNGVGCPASSSLAAGTYTPQQSFDNLIGCPLNGDWTITITDDQGADNGYIFFWAIDFNMPIPNYSFTPDYPVQNWSGPGINGQSGPNTSVTPAAEGTYCYTFTVTDNFECDYDTTVCITVFDPGDPGHDSTASICLNHPDVNLIEYLGGNPDVGGTWTGPGVSPNGVFNPSSVPPGDYTYTYTLQAWQCDTQAHVYLTVNNDIVVDFDYSWTKGCYGDTVTFTNLSDSGTVKWNFGDGSPFDSLNQNPVHVYLDQDQYNVVLTVITPLGCVDSMIKVVDTRHPFNAAFGQSTDSVCQTGENTVTFFNQSTGDIDGYYWEFGDGDTSTQAGPTHQYTLSGTHQVMLVVKETGLICYDTAYGMVYVDSLPHLTLFTDRDTICTGERSNFSLDYLQTAKRIYWEFGDGSSHDGLDDHTYHAFEDDGVYEVAVTTEHPVCPAISDRDTVWVNPFPVINLGPDTTLCLNGAPFEIHSLINAGQPGIAWLWNTGDTTPVIKIVHPGTYSVSADLNGCATTDDIVIKKDCYTDIPNVFSPNSDGANDYFFPRQFLSQGVVGFNMTIFNRWGEKVFESNNTGGRGWDGRMNGKDQPVGVYVYQIDVVYKNGTKEHYEGNVSLLR